MKRFVTNTTIILSFAAGHALMVYLCHLGGIANEMLLTLLTMIMVMVLCFRRKMNLLFMAAALILANVFGLLMGFRVAALIGKAISDQIAVYTLSTFLSTILLGYIILGLTYISPSFIDKGEKPDDKGLGWLLASFVIILCIRMIVILLFSEALNKDNIVLNVIVDYAVSCMAVVFLAGYAREADARAIHANEEADLAQSQYTNLKQQVNPHFLFNSLNTLDCLVAERQDNEARSYIRKLSGMYRYMLQNEREAVVPLREELGYADMYVELMKVRFPEGLNVEKDIREDDMSKKVVTYSIQMLLENAIKHNSIMADNPLSIRIISDGSKVTVENNVIPKLTPVTSTGLGLKYIQQSYMDRSEKDIIIKNTPGNYSVTLPLLNL